MSRFYLDKQLNTVSFVLVRQKISIEKCRNDFFIFVITSYLSYLYVSRESHHRLCLESCILYICHVFLRCRVINNEYRKTSAFVFSSARYAGLMLLFVRTSKMSTTKLYKYWILKVYKRSRQTHRLIELPGLVELYEEKMLICDASNFNLIIYRDVVNPSP